MQFSFFEEFILYRKQVLTTQTIMSDYKILYTIILLLSTLIISCSSDSPVDPEEEDIPIGDFSLLSPQNESTVLYIQPLFSWEEAEDSINTDITYELHFGKNNPPSNVLATGLERPEYTPDIDFESGSTYYWQVVAANESGERTRSKEIYSLTYTRGSGVIANKNMGMLLRQEHSLIVFQDKLWMFGGRQHRFGKKDVWYSEDGTKWELATEEAEFPAREQHTALVYDDKIWLIGGEIVGGFFKDVWYTEDGSHWVKAAEDTPLGRRNGHSSVAFDDKMWVIGGSEISDDYNETFIQNDVWHSTDGVNWTQATEDAGFEPRSGHKSVVFDNKIWVIGGRLWNEQSGYSDNIHDVWYSENGVDWTMAAENVGFDVSGFDCVVFDNKIWLIGGIDNNGNVSTKIWYSTDGSNWQESTPFFGRDLHANAVYENKIWGVGGDGSPENNNDSWYLELP